MKALRAYDIDLQSLKIGEYQYEYQLKNDFFGLFEFSELKEGNFTVQLELKKRETFIELDIRIDGKVKLVCDRSLDIFSHAIRNEEVIILKFGDHNEVISDEIEIIDENTQKINIAGYLYEMISVAIPMKKLHPRYLDEDGLDEEEDEIVYSTEKDSKKESEKEDNGDIDPRWQELLKLKRDQ
ncbi:MAG: DUF177 domain-containing protein [Cyclobacteriaceae bacterium]